MEDNKCKKCGKTTTNFDFIVVKDLCIECLAVVDDVEDE